MQLNDFNSIMQERLSVIENYLNEVTNIKVGSQQKIIEAMKYSLLNGGKRIRALLTLGFCEACGENYKKALPFATSLEMIHAYSLIHDDLPCMDNDDFRRGKPSSHKVFGEAMALLAGDCLLNTAFETISTKSNDIFPENVIRAMAKLSILSGYLGMIGGQVIDIENEGQPMSSDLLLEMHKMKTGALIKASCALGVIASNGSVAQLEIAEKYAELIGLAFQIQDDILDVEGNEKTLGKPIGSDKENNKATYVTIFGIEKARNDCKTLYKQAKELLADFDDNNSFLLSLTEMLEKRNY